MTEAVGRFIRSTAWEMFEVKPYDHFHLALFAIGLILIHFLTEKLRSCSRETSDRVLFGSAVFLLVIEIYKQLFYWFVVTPGEYSWWILPFQICSTPMYFLLILPFVKRESVREAILHYSFAFGLFGGLATYLVPSGMMHAYWTLTLHSFVWHWVLMFIGVHILKNRSRGFGSFEPVRRMFLSLAAIALMINIVVKQTTGAYINMFFVGPERSSVIFLGEIHDRFGWLICLAVVLVFVVLAVGLASRFVLDLYHRREDRRLAEAELREQVSELE